MRILFVAVALVACHGKSCEVPTDPDARRLVGQGEACLTLWDCEPGLTCENGQCEPAPETCFYDEDCPPAQECVDNFCAPKRDAAASELDARARDVVPSDATTTDATTFDASPTPR